MLVKKDLRSTKNELLDKYSSHIIHQSYVKRDCRRRTLSWNFTLRFLDKSLWNAFNFWEKKRKNRMSYCVFQIRGRRHLVFASDKQLELHQQSKTWYIDGTFKVCRQPFTQLLTLKIFWRLSLWKFFKRAIAREIMLLLSNIIHEKGISQRQGKRNFDSLRALCNLYSYSSFAPVLHDKCSRFQPIRGA